MSNPAPAQGKVLKRLPGASELSSEESRIKSRGQRVHTGSSWGELDLLFKFICFREFFYFPKLGIPALKVPGGLLTEICWQGSWAGSSKSVPTVPKFGLIGVKLQQIIK